MKSDGYMSADELRKRYEIPDFYKVVPRGTGRILARRWTCTAPFPQCGSQRKEGEKVYCSPSGLIGQLEYAGRLFCACCKEEKK